MRLATSLVVLCASLGATLSTANADSTARFEVVDRGDAVEVIAHDVKAAKTTIAPIRSRLEVPIVGANIIPKLVPASDKTIKVVELDGTSQQVLSVKLGFERPDVQKLAKVAQAVQVGNDLHIIVPRAVPAAGATVTLPEPTLSPEIEAKAAAIAPVIDVAPPAPVVTEEPKVAPEPAQPAEVPATGPLIRKTEPAPATTDAKADAKKSEAAFKAPQDSFKNFPMLLACVLALVGSIVWVRRRKNGATAAKPATTIEIIAQKSLGRQARIVWFTAGSREMIVSVTAQQVRMLGQWKKSESAMRSPVRAEGSGPQPVFSDRARRISQPLIPEATAMPTLAEKSSAVSGLLKLRAKSAVMQAVQLPDDVATDDVEADAVWAREILAATGARR